jgi:hypothetical protein
MEILPTNGPAPAGKSFSENIMDFVRFLNACLLWRNLAQRDWGSEFHSDANVAAFLAGRLLGQ